MEPRVSKEHVSVALMMKFCAEPSPVEQDQHHPDSQSLAAKPGSVDQEHFSWIRSHPSRRHVDH
eukprot:531106-Karenia_brevis.AAC.1